MNMDVKGLLNIQAECRKWKAVLIGNGWVDDDATTHTPAVQDADSQVAELALVGSIREGESALMYCRQAFANSPSNWVDRAFDYIGIRLRKGPDVPPYVSVALAECLIEEAPQSNVQKAAREPTFLQQLQLWIQQLGELPASKQKTAAGTPGRRSLSLTVSKQRTTMLEDWEQANATGTSRKDFCLKAGIPPGDLRKYQNWDRQRKNRQQ